MRKFGKILLITLILITISIIVIPHIAEASMLSNIIEESEHYDEMGTNYWESRNMSMGDVVGEFNWVYAMVIAVVVIMFLFAFAWRVFPVVKSLWTHNGRGKALSVLIGSLITFIVALVVLNTVFKRFFVG